MDYEKRYKEIINKAKHLCSVNLVPDQRQLIDSLLPELKELETNEIKEEIIIALKGINTGGMYNKHIAWLENICKQTDNYKPMFKVGDWIKHNKADIILKITKVTADIYYCESTRGNTTRLSVKYVNETFHLWSIQDAKPGDILATENRPFIFKGFTDEQHPKCPVAYCGIDATDLFLISANNWWITDTDEVYPATNEQRKLLYQKNERSWLSF